MIHEQGSYKMTFSVWSEMGKGSIFGQSKLFQAISWFLPAFTMSDSLVYVRVLEMGAGSLSPPIESDGSRFYCTKCPTSQTIAERTIEAKNENSPAWIETKMNVLFQHSFVFPNQRTNIFAQKCFVSIKSRTF